MQENVTELISLATDKVNLGRQLMSSLSGLLDVAGVRRVQEQISREVNCLLKVINEGTISINVINASKLLHLECLVKILLKCRGLTSVDYVLPLEESEADPMRVDIVCENGACNVNVEAKNLHQLSKSERILNQAEEFVEAATSNPEVPKAPQVCLIFDNELDNGLNKGGGGMDDSLLDFVNSIVRMDQADRPWELHLSNCATQPEVQALEMENKHREPREIKRIQIQQRKPSAIIKSPESDRKRMTRADKKEVGQKYRKTEGGQILTLSNVEGDEGHEEIIEVDPGSLLEETNYGAQVMEEIEEEDEEEVPNATYSESQNFFCDACKESGLAYEQEILRLREELKQKDSIINSLKSLIGPAGTRIVLPGGERGN